MFHVEYTDTLCNSRTVIESYVASLNFQRDRYIHEHVMNVIEFQVFLNVHVLVKIEITIEIGKFVK